MDVEGHNTTLIMYTECKDVCKSCRVQRLATTTVCIFTCLFAFSCCIYCTWIIRSYGCHKCKEDPFLVTERKTPFSKSSTRSEPCTLRDDTNLVRSYIFVEGMQVAKVQTSLRKMRSLASAFAILISSLTRRHVKYYFCQNSK